MTNERVNTRACNHGDYRGDDLLADIVRWGGGVLRACQGQFGGRRYERSSALVPGISGAGGGGSIDVSGVRAGVGGEGRKR